ncbi:MAG: hypothetical protein ABH832_02400 [bacterium]
MKEPTYENAITNSWSIAWKHKSLWVLGLLAALLGQFGLSSFFSRVWFLCKHGTVTSLSWAGTDVLTSFADFSWKNIMGFVWLGVIMLIIFVGVVFVAISAQSALVYYLAANFEKKKFTDLSKAWHKGVQRFWQVFGINVLYKLTLVFLVGITIVLLRISDINLNSSLNYVFGLLIGLILLAYIFVSIVYVYSLGYAIIGKFNVVDSIGRAFRLLSDHVLVSLEVGIIMMFLNLLLFIVAVCSLLIAFLPVVVIWIVAAVLNLTPLAIFGFVCGIILWLLLIVVVGSVYNVFNTGAWIYLFVKMHKEGVISRLVHYARKMFKK